MTSPVSYSSHSISSVEFCLLGVVKPPPRLTEESSELDMKEIMNCQVTMRFIQQMHRKLLYVTSSVILINRAKRTVSDNPF